MRFDKKLKELDKRKTSLATREMRKQTQNVDGSIICKKSTKNE